MGIAVASPQEHSVESPEDRHSQDAEDFFEKEIRPLLVEHCFECHSGAAKTLRGKLLLDSRAGWMRGGDSGEVIVPGKPDESLLLEAVSYENPDLSMPPRGKLSDREIAVLRRWIAMGAPDPRDAAPDAVETTRGLDVDAGRAFWSYRAPVKSPPPAVHDTEWPRTPIDRFLLARMEAAGARPVGDADRTTLARRVYFDLVGLPPTPEELDRFLGDTRRDALERLVDGLLDSPRFGERWGRHWLDVARYAESVVLRGMLLEHAWRYRDFVIDAFNEDMPFDEFVREQLAGDLIPGGALHERQRRRVATTLLILGDHTLESQDKRQLDMDVVDEQLEVIGRAFLGQTIACARCHDHKFDPIPTRDYYALAGILRGVDSLKHANVSGWVEMPLPLSEEDERVHARHAARVATARKELEAAKELLAALAKPEAEADLTGPAIVPVSAFAGIVIDDSEAHAVGEWKRSQWSKRYIGDGYRHDAGELKGEKSLTFTPRIERPGVYEVRFAYSPGTNRSTNVPVTVVCADGEETLVVDQKQAPPVDGRWVRLGRFRFAAGDGGFVRVDTRGSTEVVIADAVQFVSPEELATSVVLEDVSAAAREAEANEAEERASKRAALAAEVGRLEAEVKKLEAAAPPRPKVFTVKESEPSDIPIHVRGSVHSLGNVVPRGVLAVTLHPGEAVAMPQDQSGRLELADWIASASNPLTARVFVNRAWHWLFGRGIVSTPDNFGTTGRRPTHPELLDWLAVRFVEEGWSVKWLVREIVLSRAYGLASHVPEGARAAAIDPANDLFWHRPLRQLEAECLRDAMLAVSGRLRLEMGGRSFPESLKSDYGFQYDEPRRSVYVPVFRNAIPEIFEVFDGAHPSMVTGKRDASIVAPQALYLLNHPFVLEQAEATGARLAGRFDDVREGIEHAYKLVLARMPTEREQKLAERNVRNASDEPLAAWTRLVHVLLNSLDFRYLR